MVWCEGAKINNVVDGLVQRCSNQQCGRWVGMKVPQSTMGETDWCEGAPINNGGDR